VPQHALDSDRRTPLARAFAYTGSISAYNTPHGTTCSMASSVPETPPAASSSCGAQTRSASPMSVVFVPPKPSECSRPNGS
jgi:hypothetical protein